VRGEGVKADGGKYAGQVIIEKGFSTEDAARNWMERIKREWEVKADNVETHLWVPVKGDV
jgi:hypothetical protein